MKMKFQKESELKDMFVYFEDFSNAQIVTEALRVLLLVSLLVSSLVWSLLSPFSRPMKIVTRKANQRQTKKRHVQGMLDKTDLLKAHCCGADCKTRQSRREELGKVQ